MFGKTGHVDGVEYVNVRTGLTEGVGNELLGSRLVSLGRERLRRDLHKLLQECYKLILVGFYPVVDLLRRIGH